MTINELSILKNGVLDATEAYVDARLEDLPFAKTEIGVVIENNQKDINNKTLHTVRVGSSTRYKTYKNVLSTGNIEYPLNTVVFLVIPNGQYSNSFILGQLDTSPCNILGGEIHIGQMKTPINGKNYYFNVDKQGNTEILSGSLKFGYKTSDGYTDATDKKTYGAISDYNFIVDSNGIKNGLFNNKGKSDWKFKVDTSTGDVTITSGSIVLGGVTTNSSGLSATGVTINNSGLSMTKGSINLGIIGTTNKYRFSASDDGNIYCKNADGNDVFSVVNGVVTIGGYLKDGAFDSASNPRGDATTIIDGKHIETGYIRSSNLKFSYKENNVDKTGEHDSEDTILANSKNVFTTNGTILNLTNGWLSSPNFRFNENGIFVQKGKIQLGKYIDTEDNNKEKYTISFDSEPTDDVYGSIAGWKIEKKYLKYSVTSDTSSYFSGGKLHLLHRDRSSWRQVCLNPSKNKCYISGMEFYVDASSGDLDGDDHDYGGNYIKITNGNITRRADGSDTTVLWKNTSSSDLAHTNFVHKGGSYDFTVTYEGGGRASGTILFSS